MQPERKLWIAVLLRGIADCEAKFVHGSRNKGGSLADSRRAQVWRDSSDFTECCELAGLDLKFARSLPSATAAHALVVLAFKESSGVS